MLNSCLNIGESCLKRPLKRTDAFLESVVAKPSHLEPIRLLRKSICLVCLLYTLTLLPFHSEFFGPDSYFPRYFDPNIWHHWLLKLFCKPGLTEYYLILVVGQLCCLACCFLDFKLAISTPLSYILTMNVWSLCWVTLDGGTNLIQVLFFMLLFCNSSGKHFDSRFEILNCVFNALTNCGFRL